MRLAVRDWSRRHPLASPARLRVFRAIRRELITPTPCQIAGCNSERVVAHHPNYVRPLEVLWCCRRHHRLLHWGVPLALKDGVPRKLKRVPNKNTLADILR